MTNAATGTGLEGGTLSREDFQLHWDNIAKVLDRNPAVWSDYYTKTSIYDAVMEGLIQAWAFSEDGKIKLIVFTRITEYPVTRVLHVLLTFGNSLDRLLPQVEATLEHFGRAMGCGMCEIIGRGGWERKLGHRFKRRAVVLTAPIPNSPVN